MKRPILYVLTILTLNILPTYGQQVDIYFNKVVDIIKSESSPTNLNKRLDSLRSKHTPMPWSIKYGSYLDRDLDFGYRHQRWDLNIEPAQFQIDILKRNDTILVASVNTKGYSQLTFSQLDTINVAMYLKERNKFYRSSKTAKMLVNEISLYETFAFHCGYGSPMTQKGFEVESFVENEEIYKLATLLKSFSVETQAFGVGGFEMLVKEGYRLPSDIDKLIKHIKKRNSETIICSGCFTGLIVKIYTEQP